MEMIAPILGLLILLRPTLLLWGRVSLRISIRSMILVAAKRG